MNGFACARCDLTAPHEHFISANHYGDPIEVVMYHAEDPNAEVRDPDTGEVIFPATKAPFRLITGGKT